jgi:protocatechuate 3,4-dioxygenase beta subunit
VSIESNRRNFLKIGTSAAGAMFFLSPASKVFGAACGLTPPQTPGPFYPGESQFHPDNDLTLIPGHTIRAEGQVIYVKGKVVDQSCNPIQNANVEIWQACASGKYNNPKDPNTAQLDTHFKYWAETYTDSNGEYLFKTIVPGAYPADADWTRPPHIHFKITRLGYKELVTQMYFKGNQLNSDDLILQQIAASERDSVIVDFQPAPSDLEPGSLIGSFDITLRSIR